MPEPKLKIISRSSSLAIKQVEEVMHNFPKIDYELKTINSLGDKNKDISLLSKNIPSDFFTKELDQALLLQQADLAIHSAKDLPYPLPSGLSLIALTKGLSTKDILVSKGNLKLKELPQKAKIGTSSLVRKEQLLAIRPDLEVISIRGTIEERLNLMDKGQIDALIVAECALKRLGLIQKISEKLKIKTHPLQGHLAVVARTERADLKMLFFKIDIRNQYGKVFLIGATLPEYLTIKADQVLQKADIIYYDDLLDETILKNYRAKKVYVGKRKGQHSADQTEINELMYLAIAKGKLVVRLKCGDPLIFSRGGEEIRYLQERLIEVEVIPGISSAQIAAANNLFPLTQRRLANKLVFLSGHNIEAQEKETLVYFMAATKLKEIAAQLQKKGLNKKTPVALIQNAGFLSEQIIITNLDKLKTITMASPIILIIGETIKQYQSREKILFLGLDPLSCNLNKYLVHYPLIEIEFLKSPSLNLTKYDAVLFTSKNGVRSILSNYKLKNKAIIAIGQQTKREIKNYGYKVDYLPKTPDSDSLADFIKANKFQNILYPTSQLSNNNLHELQNIDVKVFYNTNFKKQPKLKLKEFSGLVFSSASTVKAYFKIYKNIPSHLQIYVYGNFVAEELKKRGYKNVQTLSA